MESLTPTCKVQTTDRNASAQLLTISESILSGAQAESYEAGYDFPKHMHATIEIYRITSGECYMDIHSETLHCREGDFVMILPDIIHSFYLNESSGCTVQHIHFDPKILSCIIIDSNEFYSLTLMHAIYFSTHLFYKLKADAIIDTYLQKLVDLYQAAESLFSSANINVALMNLMLHILDQAKPDHNFADSYKQNKYVEFTLNYIQENYTKKIRQEDIASRLHVSVRYLSRIFREYMGVPLSNYINIYRINRSIELMQSTSLSLTDIALLVGFKDSQRFSKVFMSIINTPPSAYRKSIPK